MTSLNDANWWSRFRNRWWGGRTHLDKGNSSLPFVGASTSLGHALNADTALKLATVWACVRLRSQTIASLPLHIRDNKKQIADTHPLYYILHDQPNADMTASEFWEAMIASLELWGNAYALISRNKVGQVVSLEPFNPEYMSVSRSLDGVISYEYRETRQQATYTEDVILHIKGFSLDGLIGLSPIKYQADVMGGQIDANQSANNEWKNGLKVGGFLETGEKTLTKEQRNRLRKNLAEFAQVENQGKYMVLEAGMKPASASSVRINPQDAQLLESRYFGVEEICRTFAVPPQLIYHTDKASSWASSMEQMNTGFLMYSLRPVLIRIEQAISKKLLTASERKKYKVKFSVEGLLRADTSGRANFYSQMLQNGVMTRNEVRKLEDLPTYKGADQLTVQLNLTPLEKLGKDDDRVKN